MSELTLGTLFRRILRFYGPTVLWFLGSLAAFGAWEWWAYAAAVPEPESFTGPIPWSILGQSAIRLLEAGIIFAIGAFIVRGGWRLKYQGDLGATTHGLRRWFGTTMWGITSMALVSLGIAGYHFQNMF